MRARIFGIGIGKKEERPREGRGAKSLCERNW